MTGALDALARMLDLGGPVVVLLLAVSVVTLAVVLYKVWQFRAAGVGRHRALSRAVDLWAAGDRDGARRALDQTQGFLAPVARLAMTGRPDPGFARRLEAEAETRFARLSTGFRLLDSVAQLAPLLGLFGTVLGMIEAFRALQAAGDRVDPSILAGGIWVALLTTAVGLVVAIPAALVLSWLEGRLEADRAFADVMIARILAPDRAPDAVARTRPDAA